MLFGAYGDWSLYEDAIYAEYLKTVAHASLRFRGDPVKVRFHPETKHKGFGFWHLISEAPSQDNRNEDDRRRTFDAVSASVGWLGVSKTLSPMASHGGRTADGVRHMS